MTVRRVLVSGSRTWRWPQVVHEALDQQWHLLRPADRLVVVVGYDPENERPPGVDRFAYEWACHRRDEIALEWAAVDVEPHPADWRAHRRTAGFLRNGEMVDRGADMALVFCLDDSSGTLDCLDRIIRAKISHLVWRIYSRRTLPRATHVQPTLDGG